MALSNWDITSANSTAVLNIPDLGRPAIIVEQYSVDAMFTSNSPDIAEYTIGADGFPTSGWITSPITVTFNLNPASATIDDFEYVYEATQLNRTSYITYLTIDLPSRGKSFYFEEGALVTPTPLPSAGRVLQTVQWTWAFKGVQTDRR